MNPLTSSTGSKPIPAPDPTFDGHLHALQARLDNFLTHYGPLLFTTNATGLFEAYLEAFPDSCRQHFNCHACRRFIDTYGGLVAVLEDGAFASPFWGLDAPEIYALPTQILKDKVLCARVTGVFFSAHTQLGTPEAGGWTHFAAQLPPGYTRQAVMDRLGDFAGKHDAIGGQVPVWVIDYIAIREKQLIEAKRRFQLMAANRRFMAIAGPAREALNVLKSMEP
jgi:hypothetical protein